MSPTVCIIDDDELVGIALQRMLRSAGYTAIVWQKAQSFLAGDDPATPGCIITDLAMPEMSGLELHRSLVAAGDTRPIIFMTGSDDYATSSLAQLQSVVGILRKPVTGAALLAAVKEAVGRDAAARGAAGS